MNKQNNIIFGIMVLLNIGDLISTKIFLNRGIPELNPIFDEILITHFWIGILAKIFVLILIYVCCAILSKKSEYYTSNLMWFLNGLFFMAVVTNIATILRFI